MLGGILIMETQLGIGTKCPRWEGQVSGGVSVPWWCERQGS